MRFTPEGKPMGCSQMENERKAARVTSLVTVQACSAVPEVDPPQ